MKERKDCGIERVPVAVDDGCPLMTENVVADVNVVDGIAIDLELVVQRVAKGGEGCEDAGKGEEPAEQVGGAGGLFVRLAGHHVRRWVHGLIIAEGQRAEGLARPNANGPGARAKVVNTSMDAVRNLSKEQARDRPTRHSLWIRVTAGTALFAGLIRLRLFAIQFTTGDTADYFVPWLQFIQTHGRIHAVGQRIGEYFPPYYFLLALTSYLPLSLLGKIKVIPIFFDVVAAFWAAKIVAFARRERGPHGATAASPQAAALVVLALPSLFVEGAVWGQCDSIYSSLLLGALYCLMRGMPLWACALFGLS